jgi:hypothetical protein
LEPHIKLQVPLLAITLITIQSLGIAQSTSETHPFTSADAGRDKEGLQELNWRNDMRVSQMKTVKLR